MKPVDVKDNTYTDFLKEVNDKGTWSKVGDDIRISKWKKIFFLKDILQISLKKFLWLKKLKILFLGHMLLVTLMTKKFIGTFYEKELQKTNQKEFRIEKVIKKTGDKLYVKWKGYDNSLIVGVIKMLYKNESIFS